MIEALWSVKFMSNTLAIGSGVVVLETCRVLGGDAQYLYVGSYDVVNGVLEGKVKVTHYANEASSVFGNLKEFNVKFSGPINEKRILAKGYLVENPHQQITALLERRAELP